MNVFRIILHFKTTDLFPYRRINFTCDLQTQNRRDIVLAAAKISCPEINNFCPCNQD